MSSKNISLHVSKGKNIPADDKYVVGYSWRICPLRGETHNLKIIKPSSQSFYYCKRIEEMFWYE